MKKYGSFIVGCFALAVIVVCVLTSSTVAHGPGWLELTHAIIGISALLVFSILVATWEMKDFNYHLRQGCKKGDGDIMG